MRDQLGLANLAMHPTAAEMQSEDRREQFRIGLLQIYAQLSGFEDPKEATGRIRDFLDMAIEFLRPTVEAINLRSFVVAPADSFTELRDRLNSQLLGDIRNLDRALGSSVSDSSWVFESEGENSLRRVQFGPMKQEQLRGMLESDDNVGPPEMLFLLVESRNGIKPSEDGLLALWEDASKSHEDSTDKMASWLRSIVNDPVR